jgi:transposase
MEATGVYNEVLAHCLVANGYAVAIQPPLEVKRAFKPVGHKTDPVDSKQIAEYAYRFFDELRLWTPHERILEQIKTLLTTREQFCMQKTAHLNALKALQRKYVHTPLAEKLHEDTINRLKSDITAIEREIEHLINQDPTYRQLVGLMMSVPGVGLLLASHLLIACQSSPQPYNPKALSAFIGICPYQNQSGTSVRGAATSRHYGPPGLRRLLYLAAMSVRMHHPYFRHYFIRKVQQGKPKKLVINNIANKLLRIVCAVLRTQTPFIIGYQSIHPQLLNLKQPLTTS